MSNSYYGNGSVTGGNLENNRLQRVLLFPLELSKPAKVVQAATKKIRRKKRRRSTKHGPNLAGIMSQPDAETLSTSTKDDFESQLYLGEVFVFYV